MIYLDETARDYQIQLCQKVSSDTGYFCPICQRTKDPSQLCPIGVAWLNNSEDDYELP